MYVHNMFAGTLRLEEEVKSPGRVGNHHVSAESWTQVPWKSNKCLYPESSLEP